MKFKLLIVIIFACYAGIAPCVGQIHQSSRFEEEIKSYEQGFTVISMKKEGLALIREKESTKHRVKLWQLEILDTTLAKIWSTEVETDSRLNFVGYEYNMKKVYLLFREPDVYIRNFKLLTINFDEKVVTTDEIKFEVDFHLSHFTMAGGSAIFGGYVSNEPAIFLYDQKSLHPKVLPGLFIREMKLLDVRTNQNESFNVLLVENNLKENSSLVIRTFDNIGNLIFDESIKVDPRYTVQTGITSMLEREELIITGTYSVAKSKNAVGIFSTVISAYGEQTILYNDFGSMNHVVDYYSARKAAKIKAKARKLRENGRLPSYSVNAMPFRIEERKEGFYLLAELYHAGTPVAAHPYPSSYYNAVGYGFNPYSAMSPYNSRYYNNGYNTPYMNNNTASRPDVQMVESVVVKFNPSGQMVKDASMKFHNVRQYSLEQASDFNIKTDSIFMMHKKVNDIVYHSEVGDTLDVKPKIHAKVNIKSEHPYLRTEYEDDGATRFWYDNNFYVFGYQLRKNKAFEKTTRVFYVNKISVQ